MYAPKVNPMVIQMADKPVLYTEPGSPIIIHPDMSEAPADKAVIYGPILRPPNINSLKFPVACR